MRYCLIVVLSFFQLIATSQENKKRYPVITLRTSLLSFAEEDAGMLLGAGVQLNHRWAVNIDPTFIFYSPYRILNNSENYPTSFEKAQGIKLRGEVKYFFRDYLFGKRGWFGAFEIHYKKVSSKRIADFGINCLNGLCDFYEQSSYKEVKSEEGAAVKMGWINRLWSPRWSVEFYTGIGFKMKQTSQKGQPPGASFLSSPNDQSFFTFDETTAYPMFPCGIKFIYRVF